MIGSILVGLGGTRYAEAATRTAIDIARRHDASLTGVTVANLAKLQSAGPAPIGAGGFAKQLGEHRAGVTREAMDTCVALFESLCSKASVAYSIKCEERDEPFDFLMSQARYHDLTVLGLKALFEYGVPGVGNEDPALAIIRLLQGGVKPIIATAETYRPVQKVFAAYSGSAASAATLRQFAQLRPWADIELRIATFGNQAERAQRLLYRARKYCSSQRLDAETLHKPESAIDHLLPAAESWDADLIVLGNSAKSMLLRRVLGETALNVIRHASQPLFLSQ